MVPALLKTPLVRGFIRDATAFWLVSTALMSLFGARGLAVFLARYALSCTASLGLLHLRRAMLAKLNDAQMTRLARPCASKLSNTLLYAVQTDSNLQVDLAPEKRIPCAG